jgi:hypothetical protein
VQAGKNFLRQIEVFADAEDREKVHHRLGTNDDAEIELLSEISWRARAIFNLLDAFFRG